MRVFTIGFTHKTAAEFFRALRNSNVKRVIDIRLHNMSQLAGFTKKPDLEFFLKELGGIEYHHEPLLTPTQELMDYYKKEKGSWLVFRERFLELMQERRIESNLPPELFSEGCLLCSEEHPEHCHRQLIVDYLGEHWNSLEVHHL